MLMFVIDFRANSPSVITGPFLKFLALHEQRKLENRHARLLHSLLYCSHANSACMPPVCLCVCLCVRVWTFLMSSEKLETLKMTFWPFAVAGGFL